MNSYILLSILIVSANAQDFGQPQSIGAIYLGPILDRFRSISFARKIDLDYYDEAPLPIASTPSTTTSTTTTTTTSTTTEAPSSDNDPLSHGDAQQLLHEAGISIYTSKKCYDKNTRGCTSLDGIRQETINGLVKLKSNCPECNITVTGGTEVGHSRKGKYSHWNGYKADISVRDKKTNDYIYKNTKLVGERKNKDKIYKDETTGYLYTREAKPPHWDILFYDKQKDNKATSKPQ